ncbi:hypothetical protein HWV62_30451 [Athelia sp. TMB]|nr:hypothetical protein HWV62_30451 [Athelia sp. TMB]
MVSKLHFYLLLLVPLLRAWQCVPRATPGLRRSAGRNAEGLLFPFSSFSVLACHGANYLAHPEARGLARGQVDGEGRSFAAAIQRAAELDDAQIDSPPNSPPRSPASPLTSLSSSPSSSSLSSIYAGGATLECSSDELQAPPAVISDCDGSADWVTELEDDASPSAPPPPPPGSPPKSGKKRKRKSYASDVAAKKERRRNKRQREKDAAGPTALRVPSYRGSLGVLQTEMASEAHLPVNSSGYSAERVESIRPEHLWTPQELEEIGFSVLHWDGQAPVTILDDGGRIVAVLVGRPLKKPGKVDDWAEVVVGLEAAINRLERDSTFSDKQRVHRRGPQYAKAFGVSHGGGQKRPSVLDQGSLRNVRAAKAFCKNKYVKRVAHFGSSAFSYYGPKLYARYCDYFSRLRKHDPSLIWNFPRSVFPATTVNFGPRATCYDHLDYGNAAAGWCSITSAGSYDPTRGGHLILFDIDKFVEFPPGSTILVPSSVMRHGNTPIHDGETRVGMTQYAAGALFRYVDHGFKLKEDASAAVRARVEAGASTSPPSAAVPSAPSANRPFLMPPRNKRGNDELWNHDEFPVEANTFELSRDGKRVRWATTTVQPTAPLPTADTAAAETPVYFAEDSSLPYDSDVPLQEEIQESNALEGVKVSRKRYVNSDIPLLTWIPLRQEYLDEYLRREGRGPQGCYEQCPSCLADAPTIRCKDCFDVRESFTVLHTNGVHQLAVDFCNCSPSVEHRTQCMRQSWWPASTEKPRSAATFALLKQFHTLSLQGKLALYDYYKSQELITDGSGLEDVPFRLSQLALMVREYRHIKMLARAGRGHDPAGIVATKPGEIAVHCRACPQPGINLPEGWENDLEKRCAVLPRAVDAALSYILCIRWLYALIVAMDACFRLQNRNRSSDTKDPTLGPGWATFISSCAGFAAIFLANLKRTTAVRTTGVGGVLCSRHELWRPNGMGDLQKGERYANMDYILFCSLRLVHILLLIISYDIMCQWIVNLWARVTSLPAAIQPTFPKQALVGKIPQFHLEAHGKKCYARYSLRLTRGVGRVEGEAPERGWSVLGRAAAQTKEMGPGARHNVLDDICGFGNWRKILDSGNSLLKKLVLAITESIYYWRALRGLEEGLNEDHPGCIAEWELMLAEWEADPSKPCPYDCKEPELTVNKVKLQLANEEHARMGLSASQPHTPTTFIMLGLELEELQRSLLRDVKAKPDATSLQLAGFQDRRVLIRKKITYFRTLQVHYMPGLGSVLEEPALLQDSPDIHAEAVRLFMPSELGDQSRARACFAGVADVECRIREASLSDTLEQLRRHLRARSHVNRWKVQNVKGQRPNTRARAVQHRVDVKVHAAKMRYRHCRRAYLALAGPGPWTHRYKDLLDDDCRAMNERELTQKEKEARREKVRAGQREVGDTRDGILVNGVIGDTRRTLSWIWYNAAAEGADDAAAVLEGKYFAKLKSLRVQWAKSKAAARSWLDDVHLLVEEMRRVEVTTRYIARRWTQQAGLRLTTPVELQEGLAAYALRHAVMEERLANKWAEQWRRAKLRAAPILAGNMAEAEEAEKQIRTDQLIDVEVDEDDSPPVEDEY